MKVRKSHLINLAMIIALLATAIIGRGCHGGEFPLPICVSGPMTREATITVETDRQRIAVPFRFDAGQ